MDRDASTDLDCRVVGCDDTARRVDAADEGRESPHPALGGGDHRVLEVDGAVVDVDEDVADGRRLGIDVAYSHGQGVVLFTHHESSHVARLRRSPVSANGRNVVTFGAVNRLLSGLPTDSVAATGGKV